MKLPSVIKNLENYIFEKLLHKKFQKLKLDLKGEYLIFKDLDTIKKWGNSDSQYFQKMHKLASIRSANEQQTKELSSFDSYLGYESKHINNFLRTEKYDSFYSEETLIKNALELKTYISKFQLKDNIIAIRRVPIEYIDERYSIGNRFIEKGFLSTSLNTAYRLDYDGVNKQLKKEALIIYMIPKETPAVYVEESLPKERQRKEYELLVQCGSHILVEEKFKILSNMIILLKIEK